MTRRVRISILLCAGAVLAVGVAGGHVVRSGLFTRLRSPSPALHTNEAYVESVRAPSLNLQDVREVFGFVFSQLPRTVHVYPTENYYYFRFWAGGQELWGNLRLDVEDRARGLVSFAYFTARSSPEGVVAEPTSRHLNVGPADGARLMQNGPLQYTLSYRGKTVTFLLNGLAQTLPDGLTLRDGETFVGRTFDESGFQLVLVYDTTAKGFRFLLDPTAPLPDVLQDAGQRLQLGYRTGLAFYDDAERHRRVLIGVNAANVGVNNYYDGPFDQLPDNTLTETKFQEFASRAYPTLHMDKRGFFLNEKGEKLGNRLAVQPYLAYRSFDQLTWFLWYCQNQAPGGDTLACLTKDPNAGVPTPRSPEKGGAASPAGKMPQAS